MSRGGRSSSIPSLSLADLNARSKSDTDQAEYESEVESALKNALGEYNQRDTEAINKHLDTIETALSKEIDGSIDLVSGGSSRKHTYVEGLSDVDILVCLKDKGLESRSPKEVIQYFEKLLHERFPNTVIKSGDLAVTVKFADGHEAQLLPAIKTATGYRIASPGQAHWSNVVNPDRFARKLTQVNQVCSGQLVPTVKLIKAMNDKLPKDNQLSGYHIESMAIQFFENYKGRLTLREMATHFWTRAQSGVLNPIVDTTGQSRHVDDYLGGRGNTLRQQTSASITRLVEKIERAETLHSIDKWMGLVEL